MMWTVMKTCELNSRALTAMKSLISLPSAHILRKNIVLNLELV